ncbi:MAG TPA: hypothetical protein VLX85_08860, partial [Stellaceae bacterium]|nr:hypothetical protein [Stellaceae bacterium]
MRLIDIPAHLLFLVTEHPLLFLVAACVAGVILFRRTRHRLNLVGPALIRGAPQSLFGSYLS